MIKIMAWFTFMKMLEVIGSTPVAVGIEVMPGKAYNTSFTNQCTHLYGQY